MTTIVDPLAGESSASADVSREEILKQIFGDIGTLIEVESTVLLHGRMYVSTRFICFYSNLFGLEKKIRIPYSHIKNITKENTAMVIPNAIAISTDKKDYIFRSFWDRDECYKMLTNFLEKFRAGHSLVDFRKSAQPAAVATNSPNPRTASDPPAPSSPEISPPPPSQPSGETASVSSESSRVPSRKYSTAIGEDGFEDTESGFKSDRPASTNITGDAFLIFQQESGKAKLKLSVVNETLSISLSAFESLFLAETAPYGFKQYHESVKDTNVVMSAWSEPSPGLGTGREMKFFKPVNLPGLASTRGVKIQRLRRFSNVGMILYSVTKLEDVPAADTFSVDDVMSVVSVGEGKLSVEISFQVTFLKSTFMKYIIESSTNAEMTKWLNTYFQHLKKVVELYNQGKIDLNSPADASAIAPPPESSPAPATPAPAPVVDTKPQTSSVMAVLLDFQNQTLGDRVKTSFFLLLCVFLLYNMWTWQKTLAKINGLEKTVKDLQDVIKAMKHVA
eukprot:gene26986-32602_t